jgi:dipeptidase
LTFRRVQGELEGRFLAEQPEVEKAAIEAPRRLAPGRSRLPHLLLREDGDTVTARWRKLGEFLLWKYIDGNVRDVQGKVTHPRYREEWYRAIAKDGGDRLKQRRHVDEPKPTE